VTACHFSSFVSYFLDWSEPIINLCFKKNKRGITVTSIVICISCDFNKKSRLHFVFCSSQFFFLGVHFSFLGFELLDVSPPVCLSWSVL
jgi:hypothetical protein